MPEQPKRRGRPPGSKNRATTSGPRIVPFGEPIPMDQAGYVEAIAGPEPIKVILSTKGQAWGDPTDEQVVEWPAGWRIPQPGDSVHLRKDWGGICSSVDFDLGTGSVRIFLR